MQGAAIANNSPSNGGGAPTVYSRSPALPAGLFLNTSTGVISGTTTAASSAANYTVTATNSCGNTTKAVNITVIAQPASVSYTLNPAVYCPNVVIAANNPTVTGGVPTSYSVSPALPAGLSLNIATGVISGTPTTATLVATYTVTATNGCGSANVALNITISPAAPTILNYTITPASYCVGAPITNNSPSNSGGAPTSYSVSPALPAGLSLNTSTGVISGTPTIAIAAANYIVTASNSCGTTTKAVNITVVAQPATVTYTLNPAVYCPGTAITANSPTITGGTPTSYSVSPALPTGLNLNAATGVITGTPTTATFAASYTVTATNSCGSANISVNITVSPAIPTALNYTLTPATYCIGTAITNNLPSNTGGAPTAYSVSPALPGGLSLNTSTGVISGTPTTATAATNYTVTASNSCGSATKPVNITVNTPASISLNPVSQTICVGQSVTFSVTAAGTSPTYQWRKGGINIGGATSSSFTINPVTAASAGNYDVIVTASSCGSVTSAVAILSVNSLSTATITGTTAVCQNAASPNITFTGSLGTAPYTFTYKINGGSNLTVTTISGNSVTVSVPTSAAGTFAYSLVSVSDINCSQNQSGTATVTVNPLPAVAPITDGATSICVNDVTNFNDVTAGGTWSIINGTGSASIDASGLVTGLSAGNVTVAYTYSNGTCTNMITAPLTIDALPAISPVGGGAPSVCVNAATPAFTDATPGGAWSIINGTGTASITPGGVVTGLTSGTVTVVYFTTNGTCTNEAGVSLTINPLPAVAAIGGGAASVCVNSSVPAFTDATAGGTWSIINGTGTASITAGGVVTIISAGTVSVAYTISNGTCTNTATQLLTIDALPVIAAIGGGAPGVCLNTSTPAFTNTTIGGIWSITNGTGTASITAGGVVTGLATGTVNVVYTATNGTCSGFVTKSLAVNALPVAAAITGASVVCAGSTITLNSNASGTPVLTYTWASSNLSLATVTNAGVVTGVAPGTPDITYTVTDGNGCSSTSAVHPVTVGKRPLANITSVNAAICNGSNIAITGNVTANGAWTLTLSNGASATGTGNGTFSITVTPAVTTTYTITSLVDAGCSSIAADLTGSTTITVNDIVISTQPGDKAVCATTPVSFTVTAIGSGLTYQWYKGTAPGTLLTNTANISGVTTATLHFNQANIPNIDDYYVIISGLSPCPSLQSDYAHLSVDRNITILTEPDAQIVCIGSDATFSVIADAGGDPLLYQWRKNGVDIPGADQPSYTITGTIAADAGNYDVVITGTAGCVTAFSTVETLTVNPLSVGGTISTSAAVCSGANGGTLNLTGQTGSVIRWEFSTDGGISWSPISNITSSLNYTNLTNTTLYRAVVQSGICATDNSAPATITIKPIPDALATPASQTTCSGTNISTIVITGTVPSTVFNWARNNTGTVTGIVASGSGDISGSLTNATIAPVTVTFTITPTANGCTGTPVTATVVVNPALTATATPSSQNACSGTSITTIVLAGNIPSTVFTWTRNNTGTVTGIAASGSGDISGILTNTINALITVTFSITATANGCSLAPMTATVVVKPTPTVSATNISQTLCSGLAIASVSITNPNGVAGTTFSWTRDNTINLTGIAASGSGISITGTLTNTTNTRSK